MTLQEEMANAENRTLEHAEIEDEVLLGYLIQCSSSDKQIRSMNLTLIIQQEMFNA